jgi:hypothetical protein
MEKGMAITAECYKFVILLITKVFIATMMHLQILSPPTQAATVTIAIQDPPTILGP